MNSYKDIFSDKEKVLFITAHPDDVDVFFGGTLARLMEDQKEAFVLVVTNGARGSKDNDISEAELGKIREDEQIEALSNLGLEEDSFQTLGYLDGEVENDMQLIGDIVGVIRRFRPDIVCTHEPHGYYSVQKKGELVRYHVNHRDHRKVGVSVTDAVYPFSRDRSFFKDQLSKEVQPHEVSEIMFTFNNEINTRIDITEVAEKKKSALLSHKTQFDEETVNRIMELFKEGDKYFEYGNYIKLAW